MWFWMALGSALLLGVYDVVKKRALSKNSVLYVLLGTTAISCVLLSPFYPAGSLADHLNLVAKSLLVTASWISGLIALKLLPISTASTLKAFRPVVVVFFSIILFGERLNAWQWLGVVLAIAAIFMLSGSSRKEGIVFTKNRGVLAMVVSILTGAASALYDKHLLQHLEPLFVQCWGNFYILLMLGIAVLAKALKDGAAREHFHWDPWLIVVSVLIVASDALYFFALKQDGALLSVISLLRRCSVVVTFGLGVIVFKESHIRGKALALAVLLAGVVLLLLGSSI